MHVFSFRFLRFNHFKGRGGWSGLYPVEFWKSQRTEVLQSLWKPVPVFNHPYKEKFLPCVPSKFPWLQLVPTVISLNTLEKNLSPFFYHIPFGVEDLQLDFPFCLLQDNSLSLFLHAVHSNSLTFVAEPCWAPFVHFSCPGDVDMEVENQVWYCRCSHASESREKWLFPKMCWLHFCQWD